VTQALHVLLVDDRPSTFDSLGQRLQRNGYRTSLAPDARTALATAQSDPPDVAVLDVSDGFETCRALKEILPQVPVIIYAGSRVENDRVRAEACGADEIIEAPADRALVMQRIVKLLAR
jgi:two-component system, OmpR family, response regulator